MTKTKEQWALETQEWLARMNEYHATVGRLVLQWAETETLLYRVLLHYSKIDSDVARTMLSGTRASQLMKYTRSIAENIGLDGPIVADLDALFAQVATIGEVRDRLVHYGRVGFYVRADMFDLRQDLSNRERVARLKAAQTLVVDTDTLQRAFDDLDIIQQCLARHLDEPFLASPRGPWLYKSLQPIVEAGATLKEDRTRLDPLRSSPKSQGKKR